MTDKTIIEAAARAMCNRPHLLRGWDDTPEKARDWYRQLALNAITTVTPLIRAQVLEEAAKVVEADEYYSERTRREIAAAIRALKEQP